MILRPSTGLELRDGLTANTNTDSSSMMARRTEWAASATAGMPLQQESNPYTGGLAGVNLTMDILFRNSLWISLGALCFIILVSRLLQRSMAHLRHLSCLSADTKQQQFWSTNRLTVWANLKKYLLYAPLWSKRHNREIKLSSALNMGTLPSRFHTMILLMYVGSNIAYSASIDRSQPRAAMIAELRGRTGMLAVVNMIPLILLAGRNNPLISLLKVSFDTYNLLHRWMGRIVVLESLAHTAAWMTNKILATGWSSIFESIKHDLFLQMGTVGTVAMAILLLHSPSPIRHAFYETFLHAHIIVAWAAVIGVYAHLQIDKLPALIYIQIAAGIWWFDRCGRFVRIVYRNVARGGSTSVTVQALPGEACRVTLDMPRPWKFKPGCHVYLYLPAISLWQSHPFSVAWGEEIPGPEEDEDEKLPSTIKDLELRSKRRGTISLVIHKRTGMTAKLYDRAERSPDGQFTLRGFAEGPYGGLESLHSYGTVVMFAGGIGITHQVPHVRDLVQGYANGTVAARKIVLVWIVKTTENLEWVRPWMDIILQMRGRREVLKILLFVTKPKSPREVVSPSATVQMFPGRPNPQVILDKEIEDRVGAMAVTVCGPGALADSVRDAARKRVGIANIDFIEEAFTW